MKSLFYTLLAVAAGATFIFYSCQDEKQALKEDKNKTVWVDPFIGTEIGNTLPGVNLPFGMVRLGPDVAPPNHTTGYRPDKPIRGFTHNHLSGTGGGARYGNIMLIPETGEKELYPQPSKYNEYARPGYYSVTLKNGEGEVKAELTATARTGVHRYTFFKRPKADTTSTLLLTYLPVDTIHAHVLIDASTIINMVEAEATSNTYSRVSIISDHEIEGSGAFKGGWGGENPYEVFFAASFSRPFTSSGTWADGRFDENAKQREGVNIGAYTDFVLRQQEQVEVRVGISYISQEKARENLEESLPREFDAIRSDADSTWNRLLDKIEIEGGTPEQKTTFYTALYHTFVMPAEMGKDENPGWQSDKTHFWDFYTLWDTHRTVMPLHTLLIPEKQSAIVQCLLDIYEHRGWLPDAWTAGDYAYVQGGTNADVVIADAVIKSLPGIDLNKAYAAIRKNADSISDDPYKYGRYNKEYNGIGYLSSSVKNGSSRTLEYAYNDFCIAQVAKRLGKEDDYQRYLKRSYNSLNLFDSTTGFFWAKDHAGKWMPGFSPTFKRPDYWNGPYFYEGTPWVYSTYFPHDVQLLINKHGGDAKFIQFLDELFDGEHYEIGNEPGFLTPYLYHYAGSPHRSMERIRKLLSEFTTGRAGLPGQDDSGAMSAWYVFNAMGFYPVAGQDLYLVGSPLFPQSSIHLANGKAFTVCANKTSRENKYVQSAKLNGQTLNKPWFTHEDLKDGGSLELEMGSAPSGWGRQVPPPSLTGRNK